MNDVVVPLTLPARVPLRKIWYPATPTLSVEAAQAMVTVVSVAEVVVGVPGAVGFDEPVDGDPELVELAGVSQHQLRLF